MNKSLIMVKTMSLPSIYLQLLLMVIEIVRKKIHQKSNIIPSQIDGYKIKTKIIKDEKFTNYSTGIYTKNKKNYFIKSWQGSFKNIYYFSLLKEAKMNILLSGMKLSTNNRQIAFPEIEDILITPTSFSVVYEYVNGKELSRFSSAYQYNVITIINTYLKKISPMFSHQEKKLIGERPYPFFLLFIPLALVCIKILTKNLSIKIFMVLHVLLIRLSEIKKSPLQLAHRDLYPENIIITSKHIYLTDLETMTFTFPNYDLCYIISSPSLIKLAHIITTKSPILKKHFFSVYIPLQLAASTLNNSQLRNDYVKKLIEAM